MQSFIITLLICSVTMSALALSYMAITPLLAKRYSVKSRYYAWLIIVLGFIIPFRPHFDNAMVNVDIPSQTLSPVVQIGNGTLILLPAQDTPRPTALPSVSLWQIIMIVWLVGMLAVFAYHVIKHYRFMKMLRRWSETVVDEQVMALVQDLTSELKINRQIDLKVCSCIGSPMLVGFIKPQILIPQLNFVKDELRFILKHELVHFKRKDLCYKCFVLLATAIHWFNPIVYLMAKTINIQCELSCDAEVVQSTNEDIRLHYSETIIGVIKYHSKLNTAFSTNFYGGKKGMKKRIFSIMDMSKKRTGLAVICCALIVTMGTGAAFAASSSVSASNNHFDYEENLKRVYADIERRNAEIEEAFRESNAKIFAIYEQYGLTYSKEANRLYYNGELVRYFEDNQNTDGTFSGTTFPNIDGNVDIHSVRNSAGKLIGVEPYGKTDFDARTTKIQNENSNIANVSGFAANASANTPQAIGNTTIISSDKAPDKSNVYDKYKQYGLTYDKATDNLYYNGTLVRYFKDYSIIYNGDGTIDGSVIDHTSNNGKGEIDIYAVRNSEGQLTGVRIADQDEYSKISIMAESMTQAILKYKEFGLSVNATGKMYFEGYPVREVYDSASGQLITESIGAAFPENSIDVIAIYSNGKLTGLRKATQEEYDVRTEERINNVQDYWVEQQNKRQ